MDNKKNTIQVSFIQESTVENFLQEVFRPSKNRLKKFFNKNFLQKTIYARKSLELAIDFVNDGLINPEYSGPLIPIIFEDENFLVLDKPSNLFVHPLSYSEKNNCLSFLRSSGNCYLDVNREQYDRGLLYRLDFETSGVLIYVKNELLYFTLRNAFHQMAKEKIYLARVGGRFTEIGSFVHYLIPTLQGHTQMRATSDKDSKAQLAKLELLETSYREEDDTSLLKIKLETGLRHQIRVQLKSLGFPILGDVLYGGRTSERLCLHAYQYQLEVEGKTVNFESKSCDFV